ncbi:MAG: right-handed parallel beta-helix repeat-containing protein [Candidatus Cloacimonetes bacterium]|nr:right-handed parallel beta-helix repeat-containing protein [Candidatus Cloacimonadota bacterium]
MRWFILFLIALILILLLSEKSRVIRVDSSALLQEIFRHPVKNVEIQLRSGEYILQPQSIIDSTCGNCQDPGQQIPATAGLIISGKKVCLFGPPDSSAVIRTNAGYGLYILNCAEFMIENITITGGIRDTASYASDAALVIKNSRAYIRHNLITENLGDSLQISRHVSGIMGICGRENSQLLIQENRILRNSWDGIALYRDTEALITGNIIDGIDKAGVSKPLGGRGVAIGVTWNARAVIESNYVTRYWKGIGIFVDAQVESRNNIIEDMITWGVALWDADRGKPRGIIAKNIIYDLGAMGVALTTTTGEMPGHLKDNLIVKTAQDSAYDSPDYYGYQCALALHSVPEDFIISGNIFYDNRRASPDLPDYDTKFVDFTDTLQKRKENIRKIRYLENSRFYREFKEYLDHMK